MRKLTTKLAVYFAVAAVLGSLFFVTNLTSRKRAPTLLYETFFCDASGSNYPSAPFRMIFYLDVNACLVCNEDMEAWRQLCRELRGRGGIIAVYAKRSDSMDVAWAMHLEGISDTTRVLEDAVVEALGWRDLGTPVKVLLDSLCRPVRIAGLLGNRSLSRDFFDEVMEVLCGSNHALLSVEPRRHG
jgi:hypothetical protein